MAQMFYAQDCNLEYLMGKKIAIVGYGSQGHAHALNLRDSGCDVVVALYEGSKSWKKAEAAGLTVMTTAEAAKVADMMMILINDEKQAAMYHKDIEPYLRPGMILAFAHGFNIESLAVGPTQDREVSRITIVVLGDDAHIEQLVQQLYKLICVQKVQVLSNKNDVERQLLLVKVAAGVKEREGLMRLVDIFKAKVLDVTKSSMILEITGDNDKITAMMRLLEDYGILELVRTGVVALERGDEVMSSDIFD